MKVQGKQGMQQRQKKFPKEDRMIRSFKEKDLRQEQKTFETEICYFVNKRDVTRYGLGFW
jgi:hypothetical protein